VRWDGREVGAGQVAVGRTAVVPGVQHAQAANVDVEHARAQHVACAVRGHLDAVDVHLRATPREPCGRRRMCKVTLACEGADVEGWGVECGVWRAALSSVWGMSSGV